MATTGRLVPIKQATDGTGTPLDPDQYVADFATALTEVVTDPHRARAMGQAGRQRAIDAFSWGSIAEQTLEIYRWVAAAGFDARWSTVRKVAEVTSCGSPLG